jgi:CMP-N-acetylneuraminic acid synthetase
MIKKTFLAIIPARSGSKRLLNKNQKDLNGKPLIAYTIEASLKSKYITKTIVSTDCIKLQEIANNFKAETPFLRPEELAQDDTKSIDVIVHAIKYLNENQKETYDYVVLLQPTSPLRDEQDIDNAIEYLEEKNANAVISVCQVEHNPLWSNKLDNTKSMENFLDKKYINSRSQDLEKFYRLNGAIYICKTEELLKENTFFINNNIFAYEMSQEKSVDIDTHLDFIIAKAIMDSK